LFSVVLRLVAVAVIMSTLLNIEKPLKIDTETRRRDAAYSQIQHFIQANQLQPGEKLPPVRKLSDHFRLSRDSVWRALRQLNEDDWLEVLPNKRYTVSKNLYTRILRSMKVKALFCGKGYIHFSGFRRLADALTRECHYHNLGLEIELIPYEEVPSPEVWKGCDLLMVDSDSSGKFLKTFEHFPLPVIGLNAKYSDRYEANIVTDHHLGGRIAAEAIIEKGARSATIIYYNASENHPHVAPRIEGFRQAWLESGRTESALTLAPIAWSRSAFAVALNLHAYLENHPPAGDYFVTDGRLATNFLEVVSYLGASVPEAVRMIGYDGAQRGGFTDPPMTTIQQDMDRIAQLAVSRIRNLANQHGEKGLLTRVPPILVHRGSF